MSGAGFKRPGVECLNVSNRTTEGITRRSCSPFTIWTMPVSIGN
jgi:hypothetical protein